MLNITGVQGNPPVLLLPARCHSFEPRPVPDDVLRFITSLPINWAYTRWWFSCNRGFCIYCHRALTKETRTRDHVISRADLCAAVDNAHFRAKFHEMNVVPCCYACNNAKGQHSAHQWPALRELPGGKYLLLPA